VIIDVFAATLFGAVLFDGVTPVLHDEPSTKPLTVID
jgi:hypothetical protein